MKLSTRRMSHLDAALFSLETPTNHMNLGLLAVFGPPPSTDGFAPAELLRERLGTATRYDDLRLVVRPSRIGYTAPKLVDGGPLDLEYHVQSSQLNAPGSASDLDEWVGRELSYPLDRHKPLWQLHVVSGLEGGGFALFLKGHHGIMDGVAALNTALQILDGEPLMGSSHVTNGFLRSRSGRVSSAVGGVLDYFAWPLRVLQLIFDPTRRTVTNAHLSFLPRWFTAPRTSLNRSIGGDRGVARSSVPLEPMVNTRRDVGCTGTDVVLALVSTAMRSLLQAKNELPSRPLVAMVPVAQSGDGWRKRSGNRVSFEFVALATNVAEARERLNRIARSSKQSREAARLRGGDLWERYAGVIMPGPFHHLALLAERLRISDRVRPMASLIVSNLTGPRKDLSLNGAPLLELWPFGPPRDGGAVNITAVSFHDRIYFGIVSDRSLSEDISHLGEQLEPALNDLAESASV